MRHRGDHDVREVVIDEAVEHLTAGPLAGHDARGLEDAQVLAHQRLRHAERVDEFVHAARRLAQLQHDRDPHRRGQRAQQVARGVEDLPRRQIRQRRVAVLVAVVGLAAPAPTRRWKPFSLCPPRYMHDHACQRRRVRIACCGEVRVTPATNASLRCSPVASIIDTVANLAKRRGLVYQSGEIYGGTKSAWDYGPLGVELKENIKRQWWRSVVTSRDDVVGLDSAIILPREVWVASGHVEVFNDPLVECLNCHKRHRQDHLQEAYAEKKGIDDPDSVSMAEIACPDCGTKGQWTEPRDFNMMLKTYLGPIETEEGLHYLRPETAQGIFVNFANVRHDRRARSRRSASARSARASATRSRRATSSSAPASSSRWRWSSSSSRTPRRNGTSTGSTPGSRGTSTSASNATTCGCTSIRRTSCRTTRTAPSTSSTSSASRATRGVSWKASPTAPTSTCQRTQSIPASTCRFYDQATDTSYVPYVIEPAAGLTRSFMAFLVDAYAEDEAPNAKGGVDKRTVLRLDPRLAPVKAAVLPLSRNEDLSPKARDLAAELRKSWNVEFDDAGAIGRRYRRQDEIGTPFCVTVDFDTLDDHAVTIRERDAMSQERVALDAVSDYLAVRLKGS